jgi:hypothetical protein
LQLDQYLELVLALVLVPVLVPVLVLVLVLVLVQVQNCRHHRHMNKVSLKILQQIDVIKIAFPKCNVWLKKRYK